MLLKSWFNQFCTSSSGVLLATEHLDEMMYDPWVIFKFSNSYLEFSILNDP